MKTFWRNFLTKLPWFLGTLIVFATLFFGTWHLLDHSLCLYTKDNFFQMIKGTFFHVLVFIVVCVLIVCLFVFWFKLKKKRFISSKK